MPDDEADALCRPVQAGEPPADAERASSRDPCDDVPEPPAEKPRPTIGPVLGDDPPIWRRPVEPPGV
ncbi:MAG: hypothetical protein WKF65_16265 [Gaiellaceae bacterium]